MGPGDYSDYLDGLQSLDQISNWLDDQSPGDESGGLASRSVSVTNTQQEGINPENDVNDDEDGEDFKVSIDYNLFVTVKKNKLKPDNTRGGNKQKAGTTETPDKYVKLVSTPNKLSFTWNASQTSLAAFKEATLEVLRALEPDWVFGNLEKQERDKTSAVLNSIAHQRNEALRQLSEQDKDNSNDQPTQGEPTAGASFNKQVIENMWLLRATHMPSKKLTGSMVLPVMIDPNDQKRFIALSPDQINLWARAMATNTEVTVDNPPKSPAFRFQTKAEFNGTASGVQEQGGNVIEASGGTREESGGLARTPGSIRSAAGISSAAGSTNHINLSPIQMGMAAWPPASPWGWGPPPKFYFLYGGMSNGLSNNNAPPAWPSNLLLANNPHLAPGTTNSGPVSLPPASDENVDINDYLAFCHIDQSCDLVKKALVDYGITHYQEFEKIKPKELESLGVKKSKARLLVSNTKKYVRTLKKRHLNN
ncbi:uncharacterized protein PGTG_12114 [Puccinia graminis f. sp. tritici CRL 75-36-700-3]|uniref:Uncharacterized protein n=1 Tax=Puccinia graminis f. sp. tritici (strain CRL 75-36-700-3 / race SCCL) TaxID=418459 RepID=E3KPD3_PUCGT|nr:uncharacterized protein PGTG_12114 [Puccinia graminis f. sp. tritici CRL 75-36-700-3]EFP86158.2 hypothetical protein PGTG_12114 [Puccinia graminis f. sp. tritici CRL 75-36-700-3]